MSSKTIPVAGGPGSPRTRSTALVSASRPDESATVERRSSVSEPDDLVETAGLADEEVEEALEPAEPGATTPVAIYLQEIRRIPLLSAADEVSLAQAIERGKAARERLRQGGLSETERRRLGADVTEGEAARRRMTEANLRLVVSIARRYLGRGLPLSDLIQEGSLGLGRAVDRFDWRRGFKFSTYATWWIRQSIGRAIADHGRTIRLPVHLVEETTRMLRISRDLQQQLGREPSPEEIAAKAHVSSAKVAELFRAWQEPVSLEAPVGEATELGELLPDLQATSPAEVVGTRLMREEIGASLRELTDRERRVIIMRFGLEDGRERTLGEVSAALGVTRERARQIEAEALKKLRSSTWGLRLREHVE
jgi:RNA polymerase primary sigma factor